MHKPVKWKLFNYGLHGGHVVAVYGYPAPTAVAADGVNVHDFLVQQAVNKIPVARNEGGKLIVKRVGQAEGNTKRRHTENRQITWSNAHCCWKVDGENAKV